MTCIDPRSASTDEVVVVVGVELLLERPEVVVDVEADVFLGSAPDHGEARRRELVLVRIVLPPADILSVEEGEAVVGEVLRELIVEELPQDFQLRRGLQRLVAGQQSARGREHTERGEEVHQLLPASSSVVFGQIQSPRSILGKMERGAVGEQNARGITAREHAPINLALVVGVGHGLDPLFWTWVWTTELDQLNHIAAVIARDLDFML